MHRPDSASERRFPAMSVASKQIEWIPSAEPSDGSVAWKLKTPATSKKTSAASFASIRAWTETKPDDLSDATPATVMLVLVIGLPARPVTSTTGATVSSWNATSTMAEAFPRGSFARNRITCWPSSVPSSARSGAKLNCPDRSIGTLDFTPSPVASRISSETTPVWSVNVPEMVGSNVTPSLLVVPPGAVSRASDAWIRGALVSFKPLNTSNTSIGATCPSPSVSRYHEGRCPDKSGRGPAPWLLRRLMTISASIGARKPSSLTSSQFTGFCQSDASNRRSSNCSNVSLKALLLFRLR